jgi:hypothetical protein
MNILQVSKVKVVDTPIVDTRLVLNWTPSSTTCFTSHWLPKSAPQLPLVTFETLCWNREHVLSNLDSLTSVYSRFSSCQRRVAVTFGYAYLRAASQDGRRSSGEGIPVIWLVESESLSFGPSHERPSPKEECLPKCLHGNNFWEFWCQEFLLLTKNVGSLGDDLSLGLSPYEATLRVDLESQLRASFHVAN